ncbi:putative conserved protein, DUF58 family, contains vWF domain [Abditibacterium utsteinense]|uniref:Putative conserved protein, DUF58 family, contains vWF domain n=1 Tax=Abditibacterium utsteinense TaxID=1960156 RepID=A0A2S8SV65_9BACT|nr:DUF58 domain-containing protein [Abditibacterium utsteinense]PQV64697.1 putative conserved protein, DUF58 family, contains vWF domain [Abditibacterium utsteinense]
MSPTRIVDETASHSKIYDALHRKLFNVPRLTPAHELPDTSLFRSKTLRFLWGLWSRRLSLGGRYFFLATGLFFGYGATSLEVQAFVPLAYAFVVWLFALVAMIFEKPRAALRATHAARVEAGQTLQVEIEIEGKGRIASGDSQVIPHRLPGEIEVVPAGGAPIPPLKSGETAHVSFQLLPEKRGIYQLRGYRIETDFPFGLVNARRIFESAQALTVYPRFEPIERMDLPVGRRYQPGGMSFVQSRGEAVEYIGNRDYREGDSVRDIDWRATARLSRPIVREYREEYFLRAAVVLDTHVPQISAERCADFERAVSLCAACGDYMNRADYLVDILAAGAQLHHLQAGRGLLSLDQMLDILAGVESSAAPPWQDLLSELGENLERVPSVVCIFLDWDETRRAFASELLQAGAALKCVVVRQGETTLDPQGSWPGEIVVIGNAHWNGGVNQL